jgi:hypothetical protein
MPCAGLLMNSPLAHWEVSSRVWCAAQRLGAGRCFVCIELTINHLYYYLRYSSYHLISRPTTLVAESSGSTRCRFCAGGPVPTRGRDARVWRCARSRSTCKSAAPTRTSGPAPAGERKPLKNRPDNRSEAHSAASRTQVTGRIGSASGGAGRPSASHGRYRSRSAVCSNAV